MRARERVRDREKERVLTIMCLVIDILLLSLVLTSPVDPLLLLYRLEFLRFVSSLIFLELFAISEVFQPLNISGKPFCFFNRMACMVFSLCDGHYEDSACIWTINELLA